MTIDLGSGTSKIAIEESRRLIDQKKAELYELIRQLSSRRNDLAPISVLPPELLGRIFTFAQIANFAQIYDVEPEAYPSTFDFTSWLNFTYVSQKWRNVALNTPGLWNTPDFLYPTWARAMLERSKMTDVVVDCDTSQITDPAVIKEVFDNHAARIREINLRGLTSWFLYPILENICESSESLRLRSLQLRRAFSTEEGNPYFPAHLLVQPSGLQRLEIWRCEFDWYTESHPLLTHLVVEKTSHRPLLSEFATILSEMPALETLEMVDSLPLGEEAVVKSGLKVALSRLSSLRLSSTENFLEVLNVLDFLIVPCTTRVRLACFKITLQVMQLPHIGSPLGLFLSNMTGNIERNYNQLHLYYSGNSFYFTAFTNEQSHDPMSTDLLHLDLSLSLAHSNHQLDHFLDRILPGIPLFNLQTLLINTTFGHDTVIRYFGQFTTIQSMELQSHVSDFIHAMTPTPEHVESSYYSVPFPALQSLGFLRNSFRDLNLEEVLNFLMGRYERGAGLQKLCIRDCYDVREVDLQPLREIVPDVEWDGVIQANMFQFTNIFSLLSESSEIG